MLPLGFGAGFNTLIAGVLAGVTVMCSDPRSVDVGSILSWLRERRATTLHSSVSLVRGLARAGTADGIDHALPDLRTVVGYGESFLGEDIIAARSTFANHAEFVNWYATTESGVVAFNRLRCDDAIPTGRVPVGRAVRGRRIAIVDDHGAAVPHSAVGEIWVRGGDFSVGYIGAGPVRFGEASDGQRYFRTGDRGYIDDSKSLNVVGRVDDAVKIRGYLVEPAEVETAIRAVPGVADVIVRGVVGSGRTELVAHIASGPRHGHLDADRVPDAAGIRSHLRDLCPPGMLPADYEFDDMLPRTDRGKVDRAALRGRSVRAESPDGGSSHSAATTADLTTLGVLDVVRGVLGTRAVGLDDDLIDLGADSLALSSMLATITSRFHVHLDTASLVADPTIRTLARLIDEQAAADVRSRAEQPVLVPLRTSGDKTPLFAVPGAGAPAISLVPISRHLDPARPVYGLQAWGLENRGRPDRSVAAMARRNIAVIRDVARHGPYALAGHSMGGMIALEMAAQLIADGEVVEFVLVIDSHLTDAMLDGLPAPTSADIDTHVADDATDPVPPTTAVDGSPTQVLPMRTMVGLRLKMIVAGLIRFDPVTQWTLFYNRGLRQLARHRPHPVTSPVAVLRTRDNEQSYREWSCVARGSLVFGSVPGDHVELLREPFAAEVAGAAERAIDDLARSTAQR